MSEFNPIWYTTEEFSQLDFINTAHKENEAVENSSPIRNYHCLARAVYTYDCTEAAMLKITADDYYKLYINGAFVSQGPSPAYNESYYFNALDITPYLVKGDNIIAVHLYYQGLVNRVWQSGDNRFGVAAMINGRNIVWKYKLSNAFSGSINGYDTDFTESFDSRLWEENWTSGDFDDSQWKNMVAKKCDYAFLKQPSGSVCSYIIKPVSVCRNVDRYVIDTGQELCGGIRLKCIGNSGDVVCIRYAEELDDNGDLRYKLRANCTYEEKWILKNGESLFESYYYKGFRYVEILTENELSKAEIVVRHYPFDDEYCNVKFADDRLSDIFRLCKNTIKYSTQEGFIDCPTREKGQYLGDVFIAAHSHILLTGSTALTEKAIDDFARSSKICKGLMAVAPCSYMQEIADYSLLFGELLLMCYSFNKDKAFLKKYYSTAKDIIHYFSEYQRGDGLLACVNEKWNMVDWAENMRDGYDFELSRPITSKAAHTVINAYYLGAVSTLNKIEDILEIDKSFDYDMLKAAYINAFFRNELLADSECSEHCSLHSNALSLYFDLVPENSRNRVADFIIGKGFSCSPYMSYFVMKALLGAGRRSEAYKLLVNDGAHGWLNMIKEGATTCFEAWGKDEKWNTSLCHPWSTAPIPIILEDFRDYALSDNE